MSAPNIDFRKLVFIYNPSSTNAPKAKAHIASLEKAYPGRVTAAPTDRDPAKNRETLKKLLRQRDILVVAGGDGSLSDIINCLLHPDMPAALQRIRVLPVGTGRMNDIAHMLNGRYFANPVYALKHGHELPIYPLSCVCTPLSANEQPFSALAMYSVGFGMSAVASENFNDPEFRVRQKKRTLPIRELEIMKKAWDIARGSKRFDITLHGTRRSVIDASSASGNIIAGYYRLPARFSNKEFFFSTLTENSISQTAKLAAKLMTNRFKEGEIAQNVQFTLHEPVLAHIGGEPFTPPAPCEVTIGIHKKPVIMIATNPKA